MTRCSERGISLVEMTIAAALTSLAMATLFAVMHPADGAFATEPEVADVQQRARVAVDALTNDLSAAGAGAYIGAQAGPLLDYFAPIRPLRTGTTDDSVSITYVPATAVQTTLIADFPQTSDTIQVSNDPGCPVGTPLCGLKTGMTVVIYDAAGHSDSFSVVDTAAAYARLRVLSGVQGAARPTYRVGSKVVEARVRTYSRKITASPRVDQLMRDDVPVSDHVVGLTFTYFGNALPPVLNGGVPSYGPPPPPPHVQTTDYPAGESCTFTIDQATEVQSPRLPALNESGELIELLPLQLVDGPWCPDDVSPNRWDADLLRIRTIRVRVRIEAALPALRGPAGALFVNGGNARSSAWVPDLDFSWDLSPRNLNMER